MTAAGDSASPESVESLMMAVEQAKAILEYDDIDLMSEVLDYLNATVDEFKTQNPS